MKLTCCAIFALSLVATAAQAVTVVPVPPAPIVTESVTRAANGTFDYQFSFIEPVGYIHAGNLTEIDLPWFADVGLTAPITAPAGWSVGIVETPFNSLPGSHTLVLSAPEAGIPEGVTTGIFSYSSSYAPVKAPFSAHFENWTIYGDPFIPGSPDAIAAGLQPAALPPVPEPQAPAMFSIGLGLLGILAARAQRAGKA